VLEPPYPTVLKPYGQALVELARERPEIVCLGADLTRQTETDIFRDDHELGSRFFNGGMAEANLMGVAGGLARSGHTVFVHSFGVFVTRRAYDQVAMAIAYPKLDVKIVGFMPGGSSPGGPSHQAIDDVALMRGLPNMTVVDVADAAGAHVPARAGGSLETVGKRHDDTFGIQTCRVGRARQLARARTADAVKVHDQRRGILAIVGRRDVQDVGAAD
jgi:transketolase C-terminal domain/subunit